MDSKIEIERLFSLTRIITSLRRCHLQSKNLDKLIFVNKNWQNDPKIGCKCLSSLADIIENDLHLEEEFEVTFERDKVVEL